MSGRLAALGRGFVLGMLAAGGIAWPARAEVIVASALPSGQHQIIPDAARPAAQPFSSRPTGIAPDHSARIEALLTEMHADDWRVRQRAGEALILLGPDVLPRVRQVMEEVGSEDVRARLEAAEQRIENAKRIGTSYITLHVRGASPKQVFAELSRQAQTEIRPSPPDLWESKAWPSVDVEWDRVPFWLALRELCDRVGVNPRSGSTDRRMEVVERSSGSAGMWGRAPSVVSGPFMVSVTQIARSQSGDLHADAPVRRRANVSLVVYAEPKLRVLQNTYHAKMEKVTDGAGNSLIPPGVAQEGFQPNNSWVMNLWCDLTPQEGTADRIATLRGTGKFLVQTRAEATEIDQVLSAKDVTREVAGKRFTLKDVRQNADSYVVTLTLYRSGWEPGEWNFLYPYPNFVLLDAQGRTLARTHTSGHGGGQEQVDVTLHFARTAPGPAGDEPAGAPVKLVWEVPTETRVVTVPFEFQDLPLP